MAFNVSHLLMEQMVSALTLSKEQHPCACFKFVISYDLFWCSHQPSDGWGGQELSPTLTGEETKNVTHSMWSANLSDESKVP